MPIIVVSLVPPISTGGGIVISFWLGHDGWGGICGGVVHILFFGRREVASGLTCEM